MTLLTDLDVFYLDHRECGELEAGLEGPVVWIGCECGARMARRADNDDRRSRRAVPDAVTATRLANLRAALALLSLPPTEPELHLLHQTFDNWHGLGMVTVGVERLGYRLSLSHVADGEWRAYFTRENQKLAPVGYGVASTPWGSVQMAAWAAVRRSETPVA